MNRKDRRADKAGAPVRPGGETDRLFQLALQSHQSGRLADAESMYRHLLSVNPRHVDAQHLLGVLALQSGRPQVAVDMIGKAIALNGAAPSFHSNIAEALRMLGRLDEAAEHLQRALTLDPNFAEAQLNLGNVRKLQGRGAEAVAHYRRAVALRANYGDAHLNLGVALMDLGELAEATTHLRQALALKPRAPEALANLGVALAAAHQYDEAIAHYRQSLAVRPQHAQTVVNLGNAFMSRGRVADALSHYEQALRMLAQQAGGFDPDLSPLEALWMALNGKRGVSVIEENCVMSYVRASCQREPVSAWRGLCDRAGNIGGLSAGARYELSVRRAIHQWLGNDPRLARTLADAHAIGAPLLASPTKNVRNSRGYAEFLEALLAYGTAHPDSRASAAQAPPLTIVGDSHSLAYDGVAVRVRGVPHRGVARLVMGAKAFHLADANDNQYKWMLAEAFKAIAPGAPVALSFGEIDCRLDEGILPFLRKAGGDLDTLVGDLATRFVAFVQGLAQPQALSLHFLSVPAPHLDALARRHGAIAAADADLVVRIVKTFNAALAAAAAAAGHSFVDTHRLSAGADGRAHGGAHIDDYHLKPDVLANALA